MASAQSFKIASYGEWKSKITSQFILEGNCKSLNELQARKGVPFWVEQTFPAGQKVLYSKDSQGKAVRWSQEGVSVSNSVHEYGGGSLCVNDQTDDVFICHKGGIHQLAQPLATPRPVVSIKDVRHADPFLAGDYIYAVQERHNPEDSQVEPQNLLVRVNISSGDVTVVAEGADFYAEPRVSPDGRNLIWIQWDKPYMPWDETSVHILPISAGGDLGEPRQLLEGGSYFGLQWNLSTGQLYVVADVTGFWNVYTVDIQNGCLKKNVHPVATDIGGPLWQFADDRPFALTPTGVVLSVDEDLLYKNGDSTKLIESVQQAGFTVFSFLTVSESKLFSLASGPKRSLSLIQVNLETLKLSIIREVRSSDELQSLDISVPQLKWFESDGVRVEGFFYPPTSSEYSAPDGSLPPVIFFCHPGPTMKLTNGLNIKIQYFTSKGFAVFDINYRGSTGRGKEFRNLLLDNWGVVDTNDMINGAKYLINQKLVDPKKVCIIGNSAGGFTVLSTLFHPQNVFCAAVSIYGVSDLEDIYKASHKFERDYTVRLVAPYPEGIEVYRQRSAIHNIDKINTPVAFFHGTDDPVVPYTQSQICYDKLKERGVTTALKLFPGESHGFKSAEAVTKSLDLSYVFFCRVLGIQPSVAGEYLEIVN